MSKGGIGRDGAVVNAQLGAVLLSPPGFLALTRQKYLRCPIRGGDVRAGEVIIESSELITAKSESSEI